MLAVFNVINDSNSGAGSLRSAIIGANASADAVNEIIFTNTFFNNTDRVIDIASALDAISDPVVIRSTSSTLQPILRNVNASSTLDGLTVNAALGGGGGVFDISGVAFLGFRYGIRVTQSNGGSGADEQVKIHDNLFINNQRGIFLDDASFPFELNANTITFEASFPGNPGTFSESDAGIWVEGSSSTTILDAGVIEQNTIVRQAVGIFIGAVPLPNLSITDNYIGTDDQNIQAGNGVGIKFQGNVAAGTIADNHIKYNDIGVYLIGADGARISGNVIESNTGAGISITDQSNAHAILDNDFISNGSYAIGIDNDGATSSRRIQINQNYFRGNAGLPIDLNENGVIEANDYDTDPSNGVGADDFDEGPNRQMNYPEVDPLGIVETSTSWIIPIHLDATYDAPYRIEFYSYNPTNKEYRFLRQETRTLASGDLDDFFEFQKSTEIPSGYRLATLVTVLDPFQSNVFDDTSELVISPALATTAPPTVTNVFLKGTGWSTGVQYSFASLIAAGRQLRPIATKGADTIEIHFSGPVSISANALNLQRTIRNANGTVGTQQVLLPHATSFYYDSLNRIARWTFLPAGAGSSQFQLLDGKYAIHLSTLAVTGGGRALDAEWINEVRIGNPAPPPLTPDQWSDDRSRTFDASDGQAGSSSNEFRFHFAILAGDYDGDGAVTTSENVTSDGDGDGTIGDSDDVSIRNSQAGIKAMLPLRRIGGADLNDNEMVDYDDFVRWKQSWNLNSNEADIDNDGDIDGSDFLIWQAMFGAKSAWYDETTQLVAAVMATQAPALTGDMTAPEVVNVIISGSLSLHSAFAFDTVDGSGSQLTTVPVGGADTISIVFSENVNVAADSIIVVGLRTANMPLVADFDYDPLTYRATWRFEGWTLADQYLLALAETVTDEDGNWLDGEWTNPATTTTANAAVSEFPSGDGNPGGWFNFLMTLLPGDANLDGIVAAADLSILLNNYGQYFYETFSGGDFNGDGAVAGADLMILIPNLGVDLRTVWILADFDGDFDVDDDDLAVIDDNANMTGAAWADGDLNGDGTVDAADLDLAFAQYGLALNLVA